MRTLAHSIRSIMDETDKFTRTQKSCGGKGMTQPLSVKERAAHPLPGQAFIGFNLHRNTGRIYIKLINHCQAEMIK